MLILTHTRTALIAMVGGLLVAGLSLIVARARVRRFFATAGVAVSIGVVTAAGVLTTWLARGRTRQELTSLTGRTDFWTWFSTCRAPGSRRSSVSACRTGQSMASRSTATGSLAYLQQGLFGVVLCAVMLLFLLVTAFFQPSGIRRALALFLITYCLIASFTQVGFATADDISSRTNPGRVVAGSFHARKAARVTVWNLRTII